MKQDDTPWAITAPFTSDDALSMSWKNAPGGGLRSLNAAYPRNGALSELLAKLEFNQAISLAKSVNRKALSLAAQASICRTALESTDIKNTATALTKIRNHAFD